VPPGWERSELEDWLVYWPAGVQSPPQGWKVHVSACLDNASRILTTVWGYCLQHRVPFKFRRDLDSLLLVNAKYAHRGSSGKFITIYPADEAQLEVVLTELGEALAGSQGPYILSDLRWGEGPLYVRYGGFAERRCVSETGALVLAIADPDGRLVPDRLTRREGLYMLPGRDELVETRRRRAADAARLWPEAVRYGRVLAELPFVRMVAVTGSLTRDNVQSGSDIDYLVVTAAGRVWVARGLTGVVRRAVRRRGIRLCPNFVLSEHALLLRDRNLFAANELVQMVPLSGGAVYRHMRQVNDWTADFLPNANGPPRALPPVRLRGRRIAQMGEAVLGPIGGWMERFELARFERKLPARTADPNEVIYTPECFKDHVDSWGERVLAAYAERLSAAGAQP